MPKYLNRLIQLFSLIKSFRKANKVKQLTLSKKTIDGILDFQCSHKPDYTTFEKKRLEVSTDGQMITVYSKQLRKKICNLFDLIEVRVFDDENVIIAFMNLLPATINYSDLSILANKLYDIYGVDESYAQRGKFDELDISTLKKEIWTGRKWTNKHHNPDVILRMDYEKLELIVLKKT